MTEYFLAGTGEGTTTTMTITTTTDAHLVDDTRDPIHAVEGKLNQKFFSAAFFLSKTFF